MVDINITEYSENDNEVNFAIMKSLINDLIWGTTTKEYLGAKRDKKNGYFKTKNLSRNDCSVIYGIMYDLIRQLEYPNWYKELKSEKTNDTNASLRKNF